MFRIVAAGYIGKATYNEKPVATRPASPAITVITDFIKLSTFDTLAVSAKAG
jgi:hypothetical protein